MRAKRAITVLVICGGTFALTDPALGYRYPLNTFPELQGLVVNDMVQDAQGRIWLATSTGLWYWSEREFEPLRVGAATGEVYALAVGMGLAIGKSIIEQHGGRHWTDSNAAPGARFHFWMQRSEAIS